jgi:hypothetical protein
MRRRLSPLLATLVLLASCAPPAPSRLSPADELMVAHAKRFMSEGWWSQDRAVVANACKFYFRTHGRWPRSEAELAGTPTADGSPIDLSRYGPLELQRAAGRGTGGRGPPVFDRFRPQGGGREQPGVRPRLD